MAIGLNVGGIWKDMTDGYVCVGGTWTTIQQIHVNVGGTWTLVYQAEVVVTLGSRMTSADIRSLFDATTWLSTKQKRIVIPSGNEIASNTWAGALYLQAGTGWGGNLIIENNGTISGIGGISGVSSGQGGRGVSCDIQGAAGQRITLINNGTIRAGGGAGGIGGAGGAGYYYAVTSDTTQASAPSSGCWSYVSGVDANYIYWSGTWVGTVNYSWNTSWTSGNTTYYRGNFLYDDGDGVSFYAVRRVVTAYTATSGGAGGAGGRGQGADGAAAAGSVGSAGGTNAGTGGAGGTGAAWGAQGGVGSAGSAGNNGAGGSAPAGGAAGLWATGYLAVTQNGTVVGGSALL